MPCRADDAISESDCVPYPVYQWQTLLPFLADGVHGGARSTEGPVSASISAVLPAESAAGLTLTPSPDLPLSPAHYEYDGKQAKFR